MKCFICIIPMHCSNHKFNRTINSFSSSQNFTSISIFLIYNDIRTYKISIKFFVIFKMNTFRMNKVTYWNFLINHLVQIFIIIHCMTRKIFKGISIFIFFRCFYNISHDRSIFNRHHLFFENICFYMRIISVRQIVEGSNFSV